MARKTTDMIFHTQGGRIAFSLLRTLAEEGMVHGAGTLALGTRQEIIVPGIARLSQDHMRRIVGTLLAEHHPRRPNIVTTRAVSARPHRTPWLGEGSYDTVLQSFQGKPGMAVDIIDPRQTCMPLFTGQIHFVATQEPDYWMVCLNDGPKRGRTILAQAIHSRDVGVATSLIQEHYLRGGIDLPRLQEALEQRLGNRLLSLGNTSLAYPTKIRPLVGFVLERKSDSFSLGIPVQIRTLPSAFLVDLALLADQCAITTAHLTPWKSLLVHGIPRSKRPAFEKLLLRHRINLHPGAWNAVCLNAWRSPALASCAENLLRTLNEAVPHAGALSIGLVAAGEVFPDVPIVVVAEPAAGRFSRFRATPRFSLFFRENFERHNPTLIAHGQHIKANVLADHVITLIDDYGTSSTTTPLDRKSEKPVSQPESVHRCTGCHTEYSERYGDPLGNISVGVPFTELPELWCCPTCDAPREEFMLAKRDVV